MEAIAAGVVTAAAAAVLVLTSSYHGDEVATMAEAVVPAASRECAVCLCELPVAGGDEDDRSGQEPAAVRALPACGHAFHADCIGRWLPLRPECPLCRRPVPLAVADGQQVAARAVATAPPAMTPWARPARGMACGFGDGRVVWTRSPPDRQ